MKRINLLKTLAFTGVLFLASSAHAAGIELTDKVLSIGQGEFTVERRAKINIGKSNEYYVYIDILKLSAWNGSVMERCRFEVKRVTDADGDGQWKTDVLKHNPDCVGGKSDFETLKPSAELILQNDALILGKRQLATEDFLRERMMRMVAGERKLCQDNPDQKLLAGCNLASADEAVVIAGAPVANADHVLVPLEIGKHGKADDEAAKLWVSIGRKYWPE